MKFRFVGTVTEIVGVGVLREFGQEVDLPPAVALDARKPGGPPLIPEEVWTDVGGDPVKARKALAAIRAGKKPRKVRGGE